MQNRYVGDVGDFGKYGLLNEIFNQSGGNIRLGINWYFVRGEKSRAGDGKYTTYLEDDYKKSENYRRCFPVLYEKLKRIVENGERKIEQVEKNSVLPPGTIFYSKPLPNSLLEDREEDRREWFKASLTQLKNADIIFLDPDNGIQTDKVKKGHKRACKYVFKDEIQKYFELGKTVIIYNHRDRKPKQEYDRKIVSLINQVDAWNCYRVLKFKRFSVRHYIFLIKENHRDLIDKTINRLTQEPYDFLFGEYGIIQL